MLNKKSIEDIEVTGKKVLVRCDFNVPLQDGVITSDKRIVEALPTIKYLLEKGAKVDEKNDRGQTPLAGVCFKGYLDMAKLLVSNGANIDENNGLGMTPFSFAIMFGRKDVARYLMIHSKQSLFKKISFLILNLLKK